MSSLATGQGKALRFAPIVASGSGDTTLVAGVTGKRVRVAGYVVVCAGAVSVKFKNGAIDLTGPMPLAANGGVSCPAQASSHVMETDEGAALILNLSAAVAVGGHLVYHLDD